MFAPFAASVRCSVRRHCPTVLDAGRYRVSRLGHGGLGAIREAGWRSKDRRYLDIGRLAVLHAFHVLRKIPKIRVSFCCVFLTQELVPLKQVKHRVNCGQEMQLPRDSEALYKSANVEQMLIVHREEELPDTDRPCEEGVLIGWSGVLDESTGPEKPVRVLAGHSIPPFVLEKKLPPNVCPPTLHESGRKEIVRINFVKIAVLSENRSTFGATMAKLGEQLLPRVCAIRAILCNPDTISESPTLSIRAN